MRTLVTEIEIDAPAGRVWQILTDFARYPEWNPFIPHAEGEVREGARLSVRIAPPGGTAMTFRPRLQRVVMERELRWLGRLLLPGIFDGAHVFEIEPLTDARVRFVQFEHFRGVLVPLFWRSLDTQTRAGFTAMNEALKARAEASPS